MILPDGTRLVFIGDSITDTGRKRPVGVAPELGSGYVSQINALLMATYPERAIDVLNTGISGNRVPDLENRWQTDVINLNPDWLSILIGINDVWRQFDSADNPNQVSPEQFESVYRGLLARTCPRIKGLVIMTPFFIEPDRTDPMRARMDIYGTIVKTLASEFSAVLVDTQAAFDTYLGHRPWQTLCADRVHPNLSGHMIIARAWLTSLGFNWQH